MSKAQKRSSSVRWRLGKAEQLQFSANTFDLVFSVDVIHHLSEKAEYFKEAYRVLRRGGKICTVTDSEWIIRHREPLSVYFPESVVVELGRYPKISDLTKLMFDVGFTTLRKNTVVFPYKFNDIEPYRTKVFSSLQLISSGAYRRGTGRMEEDLRKGPIHCNSRYLLLWGAK